MANSEFQVWPVWFVFMLYGLVLTLLEPKLFAVANANHDHSSRRGLGSCDKDPSRYLPHPYNEKPFKGCRQISRNYFLRYYLEPEANTTILLSGTDYSGGWVGIGISEDGMMVGGSAMVGWIGGDGVPKIKQYYLQGKRVSRVIADKGSLVLSDVHPAIVVVKDTIFFAFEFGESYSGIQHFILAWGWVTPVDNHLAMHNHTAQTEFRLIEGDEDPRQDNHALETFAIDRHYHGMLALFCWGLVLPAGVILARYSRWKDPLRYKIHAALQFIGIVIGSLAIIRANSLVQPDVKGLYPRIQSHEIMGYIGLGLSIVQGLSILLRPEINSEMRKYWTSCHRWMGGFTLFLGSLNLVMGLRMAEDGEKWMKIGYGAILAIFLVVVIALEALQRRKSTENVAVEPLAVQTNPIE